MKLFLRGNYVSVKRHEDTPIEEYKIIVTSGNGEHTVIDINKSTLTKMKKEIDKLLEDIE